MFILDLSYPGNWDKQATSLLHLIGKIKGWVEKGEVGLPGREDKLEEKSGKRGSMGKKRRRISGASHPVAQPDME